MKRETLGWIFTFLGVATFIIFDTSLVETGFRGLVILVGVMFMIRAYHMLFIK